MARTIEHHVRETPLTKVHIIISDSLDEGSEAALVLLDLLVECDVVNQTFGVYFRQYA